MGYWGGRPDWVHGAIGFCGMFGALALIVETAPAWRLLLACFILVGSLFHMRQFYRWFEEQ